jgi:hypothetical protein
MSGANAYLKAAIVGLAVLWTAAILAGPSGAIASAAVAVLAIAVLVAARHHAANSRTPVRIPIRETLREQSCRRTVRASDPDAPGRARPRAPGRFPSDD